MTVYPISAEADRARLPVALLTGFLGSGKTTLLNRLLKHPRMAGTAVAINEFGAIPLDQHLIDHGEDQTVVMANGCLCCNMAGDMEDAVMRIFSRRESGAIPRFDRLVVEPSGLADPAPIAQAILRQPTLSRVMRLDSIVAVVDGLFGPRQLDDHPELRHQVALADRCLVSKGDLADTAPLHSRLRSLTAAPLRDVLHGEIDPAHLFPASFLDPGAGTPPPPRPASPHEHAHTPHAHTPHIHPVSLLADAPLDWPRFDRWLRAIRTAHADDVLRIKGLLSVAGHARPLVIQGVHHVLHPPTELPHWPGDDRRSRIVVIVRGAPLAAAIEAGWARALPELTAQRIPA